MKASTKRIIRKIVYAPMKLIPLHWKNRDKIAHAAIGTLIFLIVSMATTIAIGFAVTVAVASGKEALDTQIGGTSDPLDIVATIAPALIISLAIIISA